MEIVNRRLSAQEWLDYVAAYDFGPLEPDRLVLHHTWSPTVAQWAGQRSIDGLKRFYEKKGWSAAPHIFVGPDGIWLFTPLSEVGVHANAGNSGRDAGGPWYSVGIEMVGDYDDAVPSGPVWENAKAVLGGLVRRLGLTIGRDIHFHNEFNKAKSCPGRAVTHGWVDAEVRAWLGQSATGLTIQAPARIPQSTFTKILMDASSPAAPFAAALYSICVDQGVDPGVALAFFKHESSFGTAGITARYDTRNWGNVRTPEDPSLGMVTVIGSRGNFADYKTWQDGLLDWCKRMKGPKYAGAGLTTVEAVVPKYAPSSDGNSPARYVAAIYEALKAWTTGPTTYMVQVTAQPRLRVRQGPATAYPQAIAADNLPAWVRLGDVLVCDGTKNEGQGDWHHIATGLGYVSGEYVKRLP